MIHIWVNHFPVDNNYHGCTVGCHSNKDLWYVLYTVCLFHCVRSFDFTTWSLWIVSFKQRVVVFWSLDKSKQQISCFVTFHAICCLPSVLLLTSVTHWHWRCAVVFSITLCGVLIISKNWLPISNLAQHCWSVSSSLAIR